MKCVCVVGYLHHPSAMIPILVCSGSDAVTLGDTLEFIQNSIVKTRVLGECYNITPNAMASLQGCVRGGIIVLGMPTPPYKSLLSSALAGC